MSKLKLPVIMLNVKAYSESAGEQGLALARACEEVAEETGVSIAICPQQVDLAWVVKQVKIPCLAQHASAAEPGSHTGWVLLDAVKSAGAMGTLVNHSEHRLRMADIEAIVARAKDLELETVVCTNNTPVSKATAAFGPDFIAIEPPELIGSGIPVSKADPDIVSSSVDAVKEIDERVSVLCGAGISTGSDIKASIELGVDGVLLASGVVKAKDPKAALLDLTSGI